MNSKLMQIAPNKLQIWVGFNARIKNPAYDSRVRWIADSIKENGFYADKPISAYAAKDGMFSITDGHRRYAAALLAIKEGYDLKKIPVILALDLISELEITANLIVGNAGEPLTTYEQARVCDRLRDFGLSSAQIATKVGYSGAQYVDDLLGLADAPLPIRRMVSESVISATTAIKAIKKHGDQASTVLLTALVKAGSGRVTAKAMPGAGYAKAIKKNAEPFYDTLNLVQADPAFTLLGADLQNSLIELISRIKK